MWSDTDPQTEHLRARASIGLPAFLGAVLLAASLWGIRWATYARPPLPEAIEALESDEVVQITDEPWLTFKPRHGTSITAFVFYPGAGSIHERTRT